MPVGEPRTEAEHEKSRVRFHYIKSGHFATFHGDGAIAGITPAGLIHIAFFAERSPIPRESEHFLDLGGAIGHEIPGSRVERDGIVRELQVDLVMAPDVAERVSELLVRLLSTLNELKEKRKTSGSVKDGPDVPNIP